MVKGYFLRGARQLFTLRGPSAVRRGAALRDLGMIQDGSVLIRDGRIVSVGTTRRLENLKEARSAIEVPVHGKIVLPGFVDPALTVTLKRPGEGRKPRSATELYDETLTLMRSCLQYGTVTVKVRATADAEDFRSDIAVLRKLVNIGNNPVRLLRAWHLKRLPSKDIDGDPTDLHETLAVLLKRRFIHAITVSPGDEPDWAILETLRSTGVPIELVWPGGPLALLTRLLSHSRPAIVSVLEPPTESEALVLAQTNATVVLPAGKRALESGPTAGARTFIDHGGALALTSGYHSALAPNFNMQMAMSLAVVRMGLTPEEALSTATINAAYAAGCGHTTGSLELGKQADIVVLNVPDLRDLTDHFATNQIAMVFRDGAIGLNRTRWRPVESTAGRVRS